MTARRMMRLGSFLTAIGEHMAAWRHPEAPAGDRAAFAPYLEIARVAEDALFDLLLIGDVGPNSDAPLDTLVLNHGYDRLDPMMLTAALAVTTRRIGLVATGSTSFETPYHIARRFLSADHLSAGRAGWNCVTTSNVSMARNFSQDAHPGHGDRYDRAEEFVDVVRGLWESWDDDAFVRDKASGVYFKPEGLHLLNHVGPHFKVRGPIDAVRSPQGRPVIVQAGSSEPGRNLAARIADVVFTTHQTLASARDFYRDIRARAAGFGRDPDDVKVLVALMPVVGATQAAARAKLAELDALVHPKLALARLSHALGGVDLSPYPPDGPVPNDLPKGIGMQSRRQPLLDLAARENLSLLQLAGRTAGNRGHWTLADTAEAIADHLQEWFDGGADGFLLVPPRTPESLREFAAAVVPELQRRGLFRTTYEGATLRANLGLPDPAPPLRPR